MQRTRAYKWRLPVTVKCHEDTMTDTQRHYDQKRQRQIFPFPFFFFLIWYYVVQVVLYSRVQ